MLSAQESLGWHVRCYHSSLALWFPGDQVGRRPSCVRARVEAALAVKPASSEFFWLHPDLGSKLVQIVSGNSGKSNRKALSLPDSGAPAVMRPSHQMAPLRPLPSQGRRRGFFPVSVLAWSLSSECAQTTIPLTSRRSEGNLVPEGQ